MAFHKVDVEKAMKQITELYSDCHIVGDFEVVIPALRHVSKEEKEQITSNEIVVGSNRFRIFEDFPHDLDKNDKDFYDNVIKIVNAYQCFDQPYQNQEESENGGVKISGHFRVWYRILNRGGIKWVN